MIDIKYLVEFSFKEAFGYFEFLKVFHSWSVDCDSSPGC